MMKLQEYLKPDAILCLHGQTKREVLDELVAYAARHAGVPEARLATAVWKREDLMSTGICRGIAIPHVRMTALSRMHLFVGVCEHPIADYECMDGAPVRILVFIAAPAGEQAAYLHLLARISQKLKDGNTLERLMVPGISAQEIYRILTLTWGEGI